MSDVPIQPAQPAASGAPTQPALDASTPLLLLPVNVETRFMDTAAGQAELWVRIYPDAIAIDAHEPGLADQEAADGEAYWDTVWRAGKPAPATAPGDAVKAPWRGLAARYGSQRAAWIALQTTPTNLAAQPATATSDGTVPNPAPVYPAPPRRGASWTRPAIAAALPDAWTVVAIAGTVKTQFRGSPITPDLAVGLTPPGAALPPGSPVDAGMLWLVDFAAAEKAGMALRMPLTAAQRAAGFDRLLVYGLRAADASGSDTFAALLDDHHYTGGCSLVPQGAPTNNTQDAAAAWSRQDPDAEVSFAVERQDPLTQDPDADGRAFAAALGIDPAHLAHVRFADGFGVRNGRDMLTALWPATLGYFCSQMLADIFTPQQIETARQYVLAHALPRGAVPACRVGKTPYGVLPITSLSRYAAGATAAASAAAGPLEPQLVAFLLRLWPNWLASAAAAPHMTAAGDPDSDLVGVLGMDASSLAFRGRRVLGDEFLWNYGLFQGTEVPVIESWRASLLARGRQLLDAFGASAWDPRILHLGLQESSFPVPSPTVQDGPLSESAPLAADADLGGGTPGNYIQWLRQATIADIQAESYPGTRPTSILYKILRQSVILDYAGLAVLAETGAARLQVSQLREQEIVGVPAAAAAAATASTGAATAPAAAPAAPAQLGVWDVLARPSIPNPALSWADYLFSLQPPAESPFSRLADMRASLDRLARLPTAELDRLLTETLDACSHRLDVWVTAVAASLLARQRASRPAGAHLGAFGWLEEVRPASAPAAPAPAPDSGGYVLAPSLAQASVAAVLRSGYLAHQGSGEEALLAVDLSSERVRKALALLAGVQQGQSLNALLGYLFESGLHDARLDRYAQPFRDRFPVVANKLTPGDAASAAVAASNVVDGLALRTAWDAGQLGAGKDWGAGLPAPGADQDGVIAVLNALDDHAGALGDLSLAEAVFQILRGNFSRGGSLLDAISRGQRPPTPDVVETPRGGLDLTHRVALLFAGNPAPVPAWIGAGPRPRPRAALEPWLDAWLSHILPDPATVRCAVRYHAANAADVEAQVSLRDLDVGPLDVLAMADGAAAAVSPAGELAARILHAAALPAGASGVQIDFAPASLPPGSITFPDLCCLAAALRGLIGAARPLGPQDLAVPEVDAAGAGGAVDLADLRARAGAALSGLATDLASLDAAAAGLPGAPDPVRAALLRCSLYGVTGAIPAAGGGSDPALAGQAAAVAAALQDRLNQASATAVANAAAADLLALAKTLFGADCIALPRFTPPDLPALRTAFSQSSSLVASAPREPARWIAQLSHLRPAISRLDDALTLAQLLGATGADPGALLLGQLPATASDRWLALAIDPLNPPARGRVALACVAAGDDPLQAGSFAGLLIDEWPERIPSAGETAGLAFHCGEPKARAPQALLLAVCPDSRPAWDDDLVAGILGEALDLARIRAVDLASVQEVGQVLPALYFAFNLAGATVSTDFALAAKEIASAPVHPG
ncbi:MAG TPA: hypothetical protein VKY89_23690 [Thermoanaerobaculia bacterium]|nr:hypothetical protein [Thermoanaerobaculia bacterium]